VFEKDEKVTLKIPYHGNPQAKAEWMKGTEVIKPSETSPYSFEVTDHFVTLKINKPSNSLSDTYRLKLSNELGSDSCEIKIVISDLPEPPRFLIAENVGSENVTISWKPPASDGGSSITSYIVERLDCSATITLTEPAADGQQAPQAPAKEPQWQRVYMTRLTHFNDESLDPEHKYQYRVAAQNLQGRSKPCEPTSIITTLSIFSSSCLKLFISVILFKIINLFKYSFFL
jgi:hypothetical protein